MEDDMRLAEANKPLHEILKAPAAVVDRLPLDPAYFVVLAIGVVVAALRPAELVASDQHRPALREQQRRHHVALLPHPQNVDFRVFGRTLVAAVPAYVVVASVPVVLRSEELRVGIACDSTCRSR